MNYSGGSAADGWEALLLNSFYGTPTTTAGVDGTDNSSGGDHQASAGGNNISASNSSTSGASSNNTGIGGGGTPYDPTAYAAYLQNNYTTAPAAAASTNNYYTTTGGGGGNIGDPLGYNGGGGYSLTMPAAAAMHNSRGGGGHQHYSTTTPQAAAAADNNYQYNSQYGLHHLNTATTADLFTREADYNAYFNSTMGAQQQQQQNNMQPPPPQQQQQQRQTTNYGEDFCDALLHSLDEPGLNYCLTGGSNAYSNNNSNSYHRQQQQQHRQEQPFTTMRGSLGGGFTIGGTHRPSSKSTPNSFAQYNYMAHQQQQQQQQHNVQKKPSRQSSLSSSRSRTRTTTTTTTSSSYYNNRSPNETDHASKPVAQIDPLLEQISLKVSSVSLEPLSGNEVVRHIRIKTDDVTTRFLPCVDFLVNCQQELRQGLQIAQRRRVTGRGSRTTQNMTPRQFHKTYVEPLPRRFERTNESIMAGEHLHLAKMQLQQLVKDSAMAIPQGCDHVKNAFLGGMRENESWGLRKWLSKNGGAGGICNDLEEVMRMVKALKKEEDTTKRLAEILRPIAGQAHDRLKKDVPQAYQEQSSAHPYLPFFHRLEACLKQMASYDPDDDDVICLDDSDDEDEVVAVVVPMKSGSNSAIQSSPVKMATPVKRGSSYMDDTMRGELDESSMKKSKPHDEKMSPKKAEQEIICLDDSSDEEEDDDVKDSGATKNNIGANSSLATSSPPPQAPQVAIMPVVYATSAKTCKGEKWRCQDCTFLNEASSQQCEMCQEDESDGADELADFLGGSFLVDGSGHPFT